MPKYRNSWGGRNMVNVKKYIVDNKEGMPQAD